MIRIRKNFDSIPAPLQGPHCVEKLEKALSEKGRHKFSDSCYAHADVKKELERIYNHKCSFCESDVTAGSALQVEHYRPKAKIEESELHQGYYWLGYEWSNLRGPE